MQSLTQAKARLLMVMPRLVMGGAERQLFEILCRLDRSRLTASVATTRGIGPLDSAFRDSGIEVFTPRMPVAGRARPLFVLPQLLSHMKRLRPDLIHMFLPEAYLVGSAAALLAGCRMRVMSRLNLDVYLRTRPLVRYLEHNLHRRTSALIGNSRAACADLTKEGAPVERLCLIPTGIDPAGFADRDRLSERARLRLGPDCLVLTILANLWPYKGHADLLTALAKTQDALPQDWVLLVAGRDTGCGPALKRQAEALGLSERIRWCGEVENVPGLLGASDIGLLTSHEESFPNALLEFMAARLPVIATAVGACPDVIRQDETGLLVPPADPDALARAISNVAQDPARRRQMGEAGHRSVAAGQFAIEATARAHQRLYLGLLAGQRRPVLEMIEDPALD